MSNEKQLISKRKIPIDKVLVRSLIKAQFPEWAELPIKPVEYSGWDNRMFHLGRQMLARLPSSAEYSLQVEKEHHWLQKLAPHLPLSIPTPLAMGKPTSEYPWHWSIYQWLDGETATIERIVDLCQFASGLAEFLKTLQQCDTTGGPMAGQDNFYRGGPLVTYDKETRKAIGLIENKKLSRTLTAIWDKALNTTWQVKPIWIHGDIAVGNLLVEKGRLSAVIDFGQVGVGDPACDLAIAWTFFEGESREVFRQAMNLDNDTWDRGRGWVLWKTLCAPIAGTDCQKIIDEIIADFNCEE